MPRATSPSRAMKRNPIQVHHFTWCATFYRVHNPLKLVGGVNDRKCPGMAKALVAVRVRVDDAPESRKTAKDCAGQKVSTTASPFTHAAVWRRQTGPSDARRLCPVAGHLQRLLRATGKAARSNSHPACWSAASRYSRDCRRRRSGADQRRRAPSISRRDAGCSRASATARAEAD